MIKIELPEIFDEKLDVENLKSGSFSVFIPFHENSDKAIKFYFKKRSCFQEFEEGDEDGYKLLSKEEFLRVKKLNKLLGELELGPKVYDHHKIVANGEEVFAIEVENLNGKCEFRPSQKEIEEYSTELDSTLKEIGIFDKNGSWPMGQNSNFFKCDGRGVLLIDIDWDIFRLNIINVDVLMEYELY